MICDIRYWIFCIGNWASQLALVVKNMPANARTSKRHRFNPQVGKIPWRRKWQSTPVFLLGESHGWRILVGYSRWGRKESDTTERLHFGSMGTGPLLRRRPVLGRIKGLELMSGLSTEDMNRYHDVKQSKSVP